MEPAKAIARTHEKDPSQNVPGMPPNWGEKLIPHVLTFQGILASISRVYRASDESMKDSRDNARFMLNDLTVLECIEQRMRSTALLDWHLEVEDEKDPSQLAVKKTLAAIIERIPRFMQYRESLLRAIWYGRYAVQHQYEWERVGGEQRVVVKYWLPVHGDKLAFGYDQGGPLQDKIGIRVGPALATGDIAVAEWRERSRDKIQPTDYGLAYFLDPWERDLLAVHKHLIEDGEFEEPVNAGRIHGLGIRSRIYWSWYQKQELLAWLMEYLERSSFGIEIWYYPWGNDKARTELRVAAEERIGQGRNIVLVPKPIGEEGQAYGMDRIEPGMAGADVVKDILQNYFGHLIKRYILGQTLTSEAASTGLGSNLATVHLDTYMQIIKYDAINLEETITTELVDRLKAYNFPEFTDVPIRFKIETEVADVEGKLEAWKSAFEMGAKLKERDVMDLIGAAMPEVGDAVLDQKSMQPEPPVGMFGTGPMGQPDGNGEPFGEEPVKLDKVGPEGAIGTNGNGRHAPIEDVKTVLEALEDGRTSTDAKMTSHRMKLAAEEKTRYEKGFDESKHPRNDGGQFSETEGGFGGAAESSPKSAGMVIDPIGPGATMDEIKERMGPGGAMREGTVGGFPILTHDRGLIGKLSKKTRQGIEGAIADPEVADALQMAGITSFMVIKSDQSAKGAPKNWTASSTGNSIVFHPRTAEAIARRPIPERVEGGLKRVLAHEAGHAIWRVANESQQEKFATALAGSPEVVNHISRIVSVKAIPEAFANTGSRVTTEGFAEVFAMRHYDKDRYDKLPEEIKVSAEEIREQGRKTSARMGVMRKDMGWKYAK